jgi:hypothetical protein
MSETSFSFLTEPTPNSEQCRVPGVAAPIT